LLRVAPTRLAIAAQLAVAAAGACFVLSGCLFGGDGSDETTQSAGATFAVAEHQAFGEPPELIARHGELKATLTVSEGEIEVAGTTVIGKSYNGSFPGPTMRVSPGDWIRLTLRNELDQPTNIHFHGFHTSPSGIADNVLRTIPPHTTAKVAVPVPDDMSPGTYWYHSHEHGMSEEQVFSGLSGAIVVEGLEDRLPAELRDVPQKLFTLKDLQVKGGAIVTKNIDSNAPTTRTVNGLVAPHLEIASGETQMWRIANISADIWYRVSFDGGPMHVIAEDANPVGEVWSADKLLLPPGKRFDVLVQGPEEGSYAVRTLAYSTGDGGDAYPERTLAVVESAGDPIEPSKLPTSLGPMPDLADDPIAHHRRFVFSESANGNQFFINGKQFNHHRIDVHAEIGTTEEWTIRNVSDEQHPFHLHIDDFQVISINGKPYKARSLQDTQVLPVHGEVVIRPRFTQFTGKFVYHCHILAHEDNGMMGVIDVGAPGSMKASRARISGHAAHHGQMD
jgi:suppressor of ftsI